MTFELTKAFLNNVLILNTEAAKSRGYIYRVLIL